MKKERQRVRKRKEKINFCIEEWRRRVIIILLWEIVSVMHQKERKMGTMKDGEIYSETSPTRSYVYSDEGEKRNERAREERKSAKATFPSSLRSQSKPSFVCFMT